MIRPLNYTPKAIVDLEKMAKGMPPRDRAGLAYLVDKLAAAQVFVLPDYGQLLDRHKPRPEIPALMYRPPFKVVAVEYPAPPATGVYMDEVYTAIGSSRRIALAWEWQDDLPPALRMFAPPSLSPGVVVASISYLDQYRSWQPMPFAGHLGFDADYREPTDELTPFQRAALAAGRTTKANLQKSSLGFQPVGLCPSVIEESARQYGAERVIDAGQADLMDEMNAYTDMCAALACRNVSVDCRPASMTLNRERRRSGKPPLKDMHVLKLAGVEMEGVAAGSSGDRAAARSHLRRGHIRRLGADRITWVNQTMVRGRGEGFVDKVYAL